MLLLAVSLFFTEPIPLEMPRSSAYLVTEDGRRRLEDRFNKFDLWVSQSVDGRWIDDEGREFVLAHLDVLPPAGDAARSTATRGEYAAGRVKIGRRDKEAVRTAVDALSPVEIAEKETRPRQLPRGFKDVDYWHGTNTSAIVCAYLPEKEDVWRLATWTLAEGDDFDECLEAFEDEFFREAGAVVTVKGGAGEREQRPAKETSGERERELLRADVHHAVAAYPAWHVTDTADYVFVDDLKPGSTFVTTLTNDMPALHRKYAEALPTPLDGSNVLCVARIFASRAEFLDALAADGLTNLTWSGAYWCPSRRELVAHLDDDIEKLHATFRHEAFHQYLSYAASMLEVSTWLNEGYAQYFSSGLGTDGEVKVKGVRDEWELDGGTPSQEDLEQLSRMVLAVMMMDAEEFYAGSPAEIRLKYRLAWSIVVFLEKGAPEIRFQPFKDVKKDYFAALLETKDARKATIAAFKNGELIERFVGEWLAYWKSH